MLFQFELERKNCEMEQRLKLLEKEVIESHSLIVSLSESVSEAERLCVDKTRYIVVCIDIIIYLEINYLEFFFNNSN